MSVIGMRDPLVDQPWRDLENPEMTDLLEKFIQDRLLFAFTNSHDGILAVPDVEFGLDFPLKYNTEV